MPFSALCKEARPLLVTGSRLDPMMIRSDFFKVCVVRDAKAPDTKFSLVVSMAHQIADGYTFYAIHNMISQSCPIVVYNASRLNESAYIESVEKRLGNREAAALFDFKDFRKRDKAAAAGMLLRGVFGGLCTSRKNSGLVIQTVDENWVRQQKDELKGKEGVAFVSANDIITHATMAAANRDLSVMAVNMRGRVELPEEEDKELGDASSPSEEHAGNYEQVISYRKADRASASLIRKSVQSLRRATFRDSVAENPTAMPTGLGKDFMVVTNWAGFAQDVELEGCTQVYHQPLCFSADLMLSTISAAVIFRPKAGELAVMVTKDIALKELPLFLRAAPDPALGTGR